MPYTALRKGRHSEPGRPYFLTMVTADRVRWFEQLPLARLVISEMIRLQQARAVESLAHVLMPDHLHWLLVLDEPLSLAQVANQLKGRSAQLINARLERSGAIWQPGFHDHALRRDEALREVARYIVANPLRAGLVSRLADYPHWDALWIEG